MSDRIGQKELTEQLTVHTAELTVVGTIAYTLPQDGLYLQSTEFSRKVSFLSTQELSFLCHMKGGSQN